MIEIRFYHLQTRTLEQALPQILGKALDAGHRIMVKTGAARDMQRLNDHLWTYHPDSFLPHGSTEENHAEDQPILITDKDDNLNKADVLILTGGASSDRIADVSLCCEIFDGRDDSAVAAARERWKSYQDSGHAMTYWQQNEKGGWDKKS